MLRGTELVVIINEAHRIRMKQKNMSPLNSFILTDLVTPSTTHTSGNHIWNRKEKSSAFFHKYKFFVTYCSIVIVTTESCSSIAFGNKQKK